VRVKPNNVRAAANTAGPAAPEPSDIAPAGTGGPGRGTGTLVCGQVVRVTRGTYVRLTGEIIAVTTKQYKIRTNTDGTFRVPHSSVELDVTGGAADPFFGDDDGKNETDGLADALNAMSIASKPTLEEVGQGSADWTRIQGKMLTCF
jgi:hypothetical protein